MRLVKCISCPHFQVAERTLWLWQNEFFMQLTVKDRAHRNEIFRACFDALYDNAKNHWNEAVKSLSAHILQLYMEEIPDECVSTFLLFFNFNNPKLKLLLTIVIMYDLSSISSILRYDRLEAAYHQTHS